MTCSKRLMVGCCAVVLLGACAQELPSAGVDVVVVTGEEVGSFEEVGGTRLTYPLRMSVSETGVVYVSDSKLDSVLGLVDGAPEVKLGGLSSPLGVASRGDLLYVGSNGRGSVEVYSLSKRRFLRSLGKGPGEFLMPNSIAISPDGASVYVVDSRMNRVCRYESSGALELCFGGPGTGDGQFRFPSAIAVDAERVVVGDQRNHRVQIFTPEGEWRMSFGRKVENDVGSLSDYAGKLTRVQGIALGVDKIFVLDSFHGYTQVFDLTGVPLGYVGQRGSCDECVTLGLDVQVGAGGHLLVTDPERRRVVSQPLEIRGTP